MQSTTSTITIHQLMGAGKVTSELCYPISVLNNITYNVPKPSFVLGAYPFLEGVNSCINVGSDYSDGLILFMVGGYKVSKGDYISGMLDLLNGIQLFTLAYAPWLVDKIPTIAGSSATVLANPAFALATMLDFINAVIDHMNLPDTDLGAIKKSTENLQVKFASFVGMTMTNMPVFCQLFGASATQVAAVSVFCVPIGLAITSLVAGYYVYKNKDAITCAYSYFFQPASAQHPVPGFATISHIGVACTPS